MLFNISKCKVIHIGRRNVGFQYYMNSQLLEEVVTSYKDLGIIMTSHLKAAEQCQEAYRKANRMLGLVKRTIVYPDPVVLVRLYKSLLRPHPQHGVLTIRTRLYWKKCNTVSPDCSQS